MANLKSLVSALISQTPLQYVSVRVRKGLAQGSLWTLMPFSSNWRDGGEPDLEAAFRMLKKDGAINCWDLGAHFGIHTVGLALQIGVTGQVAAFEPDPIAFKRLSRHIAMNKLQNVKLLNVAVSDHSGQKDLIIAEGLGSTLSHFKYEDEPITSHTLTVRVPTVALDDLVADLTIKPPSLIKIDIQGHGAKAIAGGIKTITNHRPIIVFSSHSPWELHDTKVLLESLDYHALNAQGERVSWESFMHETGILMPEPISSN